MPLCREVWVPGDRRKSARSPEHWYPAFEPLHKQRLQVLSCSLAPEPTHMNNPIIEKNMYRSAGFSRFTALKMKRSQRETPWCLLRTSQPMTCTWSWEPTIGTQATSKSWHHVYWISSSPVLENHRPCVRNCDHLTIVELEWCTIYLLHYRMTKGLCIVVVLCCRNVSNFRKISSSYIFWKQKLELVIISKNRKCVNWPISQN